MVEKGTNKIDIRNSDNELPENGVHKYVDDDDFQKILRSLAEKLQKRTIYKLDLDKDDFITACIAEINELLYGRQIENIYEHTIAKVTAEDSGRIGVREGKTRNIKSNVEDAIVQKSDFELANIIMYHTTLPRFAIFRILKGVEKRILLSNQDILDMAVKRIRYKLNAAKADSLTSYEVINSYEFNDSLIFEADVINEEMLEKEKRVFQSSESERRAVNRFYRTDSDGEYEFAERLDEDVNVLLYTKIKKGGFVIDTPYGNYTPDWAVVYKQDDGEVRLYFIVETKFQKEWKDLDDVEQLKIKCGTLHFAAIANTTTDKVRFAWANSYEDFEAKAGGA
jgi:type III restriction enzyme